MRRSCRWTATCRRRCESPRASERRSAWNEADREPNDRATEHTNLSILRWLPHFLPRRHEITKKPLWCAFFVRSSCLRDFVVAFLMGAFRGLAFPFRSFAPALPRPVRSHLSQALHIDSGAFALVLTGHRFQQVECLGEIGGNRVARGGKVQPADLVEFVVRREHAQLHNEVAVTTEDVEFGIQNSAFRIRDI